MNKKLNSIDPVMLLGCFIAGSLIFISRSSRSRRNRQKITVKWKIKFNNTATGDQKAEALLACKKDVMNNLDSLGIDPCEISFLTNQKSSSAIFKVIIIPCNFKQGTATITPVKGPIHYPSFSLQQMAGVNSVKVLDNGLLEIK